MELSWSADQYGIWLVAARGVVMMQDGGWNGATIAASALIATLSALAGCSAGPGSDSRPAQSEPGSSTMAVARPSAGNSEPTDGEPPVSAPSVAVQCQNRKATIVGTPGSDHLRGTRGRDVIASLGGGDVIDNVGAEDTVCAGPGDDHVDATRARWNTQPIDLGPGDDRVRMVEAVDTLGGPGDDHIVAVSGPGYLSGGPGNDYLRAVSPRQPNGYAENAPCVMYTHARRAVRVNLADGWASGEGRDTVLGFHCLHGSRFSDTIVGTDIKDGITSHGGHDMVDTGTGNDSVSAGPGNDRIYLGPGFDYGNGEEGEDRLYGQDGADILEGWTQSDYIEGGAGNDQVYGAIFCAIGGNSYDTAGLMDGAPDELFGGSGDDWLVGDKGNDRIDGNDGYDQAQPGYNDGRIDWVENVERLEEGCLLNAFMDKPFDPTDTSYLD